MIAACVCIRRRMFVYDCICRRMYMQAYMQPLKHQKSAALLTTKRVCGERGPVEDEEAR